MRKGEDTMRHGILPPYLEDVSNKPEYNKQETASLKRDRAKNSLFPTAIASDIGIQIYSDTAGQKLPGVLRKNNGLPNPSGDIAVDEAHNNLVITKAFFKDVLGRDSINNRGMNLRATVHYGDSYDNAFWNGLQMVFGDGDDADPPDTRVFQRFTRDIDITAHELGHGVTQYTNMLIYHGQSGALNEHMSDVFGIMTKQYALGICSADADWVIGANLFDPRIKARGIRDMLHPGQAYNSPYVGVDPQPDHMNNFMKMSGDYGGVHYNSGIPNRAFALSCIAALGYSWEQIGVIWYKASCSILPVCPFSCFAKKTVNVGKAMFGDAVASIIANSWNQVGVL
jgi:Zn-dependent metalloprotease